MSAFRWIQMVSLFLTLLHLTAVTGQSERFFNTKLSLLTVRDGDEVTLPCPQAEDECDAATWRFYVYGVIVEQHIAKSDRMSVTQDCSLVIKNVAVQDVGLYRCRYNTLRFQQEDETNMSVVTMTEQEDDDRMTLNCSVMTEAVYKYRQRWLYEGKKVYGNNRDVKISQASFSVSVTFLTSNLKLRSNYQELFACEVTDTYAGTVQQFTFRRQSSGEDAATTSSSTAAAPPPTTTTTTTQGARTDCSVLDYIMLVMRVAELLLITVITVLLIRARGNQRPPDDNTVHRDGGGHDGTVNYENIRDTSVSVNFHTKSTHQRNESSAVKHGNMNLIL